MKASFTGFNSPNFTPVPNEFFDILMQLPDMNESELRVTLAAIRHTFGFHREGESVELSERFLSAKTKMERASCRRGLAACIKRGTLERTRKGTSATADHPGTSSKYRIRINAAGEMTPVPQVPEVERLKNRKNGKKEEPSEEPRKINDQALMVGALAEALGWDARAKSLLGQLLKPASELRDLGYTPDQVRRAFVDPDGYWFTHWPGNQGHQKPTLSQITKGIRAAVDQEVQHLVIQD